MELLAGEVKIRILSYLTLPDLCQVCRLNSSWYALSHDRELWSRLDVTSLQSASDYVVERIVARHPNITHFKSECKISDECLINLCLQAAGSLRYLDLSSCDNVDHDVLSIITNWCQNLQHLDLSDNPHINDGMLNVINECHSINSLSVSRCDSISDIGLSDFLENRPMKQLNTSHVLGIKFRSINALVAYSAHCLTKLGLDGGNLTDDDIMLLKGLTQLQSVAVDYCDEFTDSGYSALATLSNLITLKLSRCFFLSDRCLGEIIRLTQLLSLTLSDASSIGNPGLLTLGRYGSTLQHLEISSSYGNTITDLGLAAVLRGCPVLRHVTLRGIHGAINFVVLLPLLGNRFLSSVNLGGCQNVSDDCLQTVADMCPRVNLYGRFANIIAPVNPKGA